MIQLFADDTRILRSLDYDDDTWEDFFSTGWDEFSCELPKELVENIYKALGGKLSTLQHNPYSIPKLPSGINYKACILVKTLEILSACPEDRKNLDCHVELEKWSASENSKLQDRFKSKTLKAVERKLEKLSVAKQKELKALKSEEVYNQFILDGGGLNRLYTNNYREDELEEQEMRKSMLSRNEGTNSIAIRMREFLKCNMLKCANDENKFHAIIRKMLIDDFNGKESQKTLQYKVQFKSFEEMDEYFKEFDVYKDCPDFYYFASELYRELKQSSSLASLKSFQETLTTIFRVIREEFLDEVKLSEAYDLMDREQRTYTHLNIFPIKVQSLQDLVKADRLEVCKWFYKWKGPPHSTAKMSNYGVKLYFAYPYIKPMIENKINTIRIKYEDSQRRHRNKIVKDYREEIEPTVKDLITKRGRVHYKIFGEEAYDERIVRDLQEEILGKIDIEDRVEKLLEALLS